jgi:hypothetical protein
VALVHAEGNIRERQHHIRSKEAIARFEALAELTELYSNPPNPITWERLANPDTTPVTGNPSSALLQGIGVWNLLNRHGSSRKMAAWILDDCYLVRATTYS